MPPYSNSIAKIVLEVCNPDMLLFMMVGVKNVVIAVADQVLLHTYRYTNKFSSQVYTITWFMSHIVGCIP